MKSVVQFICMPILLVLIVFAVSNASETRYVEIKKQFANIYTQLDPKSTIIEQAQKNAHYELVYDGTAWYQVNVYDKVTGKKQIGWIEKEAGRIVNAPGTRIFSLPLNTFIFSVLLLIATVSGASFIIYRQKTAEV